MRRLPLRPSPAGSLGLQEFRALSVPARAEYILAHGELLAIDPGGPSHYYLLQDYFVELMMRGKELVDVVPFRDGIRYDRLVAAFPHFEQP